jgi:hypothetical protein
MQIEVISIFGESAVSMAITVAALDRLFAIIAPIKYTFHEIENIKKKILKAEKLE